MSLLKDCEARLRYGVPLRLDQTAGLLEEGRDPSEIEELIDEETN